MYNYMVLHTAKGGVPRDFLSYYKRHKDDELYFVCVHDPEMINYLEEYLEKNMN